MMIKYESVIEAILEEAGKVSSDAEVYLVSASETPVVFEANRLNSIRSNQAHSVALRIFSEGRTGFAISSILDDHVELVRAAHETSQFGTPADFALPSPMGCPTVNIFDDAVPAIAPETMKTTGEMLIQNLTDAEARLNCECRLSQEQIQVIIANSRGVHSSYRKTVTEVGLEGTLINGTDMLFIGDGMSSCRADINTSIIVQNTLLQLSRARSLAKVSSGLMPVIFTPDGFASAMLAALSSGLNGRIVLEGASPLGDKLGQIAFDTKLNIHDDATLDYRPRSRPFDDEGVPSRRIPLVEGGCVRNFLYDLKTASRAGRRSTGSATRSSSLPGPAASTLVVATGDVSQEDMIADIREGLLVEHLMGAEQGNVLGGYFSGNVLLGYKIEHGKITGRVKDTVVSGNIYELLKDVAALGDDGRFVGNSLYTPSLYLPSVSIASQ